MTLTSRRSVLLLMRPAFMALMVLLVNRSNAAATWPSSASPAKLIRAKLSLIRINASSCLQGQHTDKQGLDQMKDASAPPAWRSLHQAIYQIVWGDSVACPPLIQDAKTDEVQR